MKYYAVSLIEKSKTVKMMETKRLLPMRWADNMIGVLPVFTNRNSAVEYIGKYPHLDPDTVQILEFDSVENKEEK
jgi:hypothetical protein